MENSRKFVCEKCLKNFTITYNYSSNRVPKYCSKSCKSQQEGFIVLHTKQGLEQKIKEFILKEGVYCRISDIVRGIKISNKTLSGYKVSILELNNELGFSKPKSKFENSVDNILSSLFINLYREKSFGDLKSPKGYPLFFDFYIEHENLLIEADGTQHTDVKNPMHSKYLVKCDTIKNNYCINNGITLIRIPYKKHVTKEFILSFLKDYSTKLL